MKKTMRLLPTGFKWPGLLLSLAGMMLGTATVAWEFSFDFLSFNVRESQDFFKADVENFTNELALTMTLLGLLLLSFTNEREEDERTRLIRLEAFQWSILVNFFIVLVGNWVFYGGDFFYLMIANLFTPLLVFLLRFHYVYYLADRRTKSE
jgi:hypothetical protein